MSTENNSITHQLVITRDLAAPRKLVWKAWTDPGQVKEWMELGQETTIESVKMDLREGGRFRLQQKMSDGEFYTAAGTYLEVKEPERLVYSWDWEKDGSGTEFGELEGNETRVTVEFREKGKQTELVLTHDKFATVKARDNHEKGWTACVGKFTQFVEASRE